MSDSRIHTELASAQAVRCWRREVGVGAEECGGTREASSRLHHKSLRVENVGVHRVDRRTPAQTCGRVRPSRGGDRAAAATRFQTAAADLHVPM